MDKRVGTHERVKLDMRFELYNLFNRVQFTQPVNILDFNPAAPIAAPLNDSVFGQSLSEYKRPDFTTGAGRSSWA